MVEVLAKWRNTRGVVRILRSCIIIFLIFLTDIHDYTSVGFPLGNIFFFFYHVAFFLLTVPSVYRGAQCATLPSLDKSNNILSKVGTYNE